MGDYVSGENITAHIFYVYKYLLLWILSIVSDFFLINKEQSSKSQCFKMSDAIQPEAKHSIVIL